MYAKMPSMAERWQKETPKGADLPEHVCEGADCKHPSHKPEKDKA